jgi:antitoxin ParD1/3/4
MAKSEHRRSTTLSISLTSELADAVATRVQSGLYTSASELIREALRALLRAEQAKSNAMPVAGARLDSALDLMETGLAIREQRVRSENPELTDEQVEARIRDLEAELESGPGIRRSPERLRRLREQD